MGWAGAIEAPSCGRSVMGSCACVLVDSIVVATLVCTLTLITMEADSLQFNIPCYRIRSSRKKGRVPPQVS